MSVSVISFGAWAIGGSWGAVDDEESMRTLHTAIDSGVNFIDTADVYGDGRSERLVARLRRERAGETIYVATKAGRRLPKQTPGGYTREYGLDPDLLVIGKPIAGGLPAGAYGFTASVAERVVSHIGLEFADVGGIGGTLAGNALSLAAMRATLSSVLTEAAYAHTIPLAERWTGGVEAAIHEFGLPWQVTRLGCRAEYLFALDRPRNGSDAAAMDDFALQRFTHLYALNRGVLLTPFHNMALVAPQASEADIDRHTDAFRQMAAELTD